MANILNIGIDASNIRSGGGLTHLRQLLASASFEKNCFNQLVVWGAARSLAELPQRSWLNQIPISALEKPLPFRVSWQQFILPGLLKETKCDILFSPGGTIPACSPVPVVAMSQNLLPFSPHELAAYPVLSPFWLKMSVLRKVQAFSMRRAEGLIFLTNYAKETILPIIAGGRGKNIVIPHGIEERFFSAPRKAQGISSYSAATPFRIKYVSMVDNYKHQIEVALAIAAVRKSGIPVEITFIGPARPSYFLKLKKCMGELDPAGEFLRYAGNIPFTQLHAEYHSADLFLFASSCENLPNILLEAMASGTPIICSNRGPMPEVLGEGGLYFNPEVPAEIESAIRSAIADPELRDSSALKAYTAAKQYSWTRCADETFAFIRDVADNHVTERGN